MSTRPLSPLVPVVCLLLATTFNLAQDHGRIEGRVTSQDGRGYGGVAVAVAGTSMATITDGSGAYALNRVPVGTHELEYSFLRERATRSEVVVAARATTVVDLEVDWAIGFAETLTVYAASRRQERIVEAPAAVTVVSEEKIEREASHGQLPKLLEFTPGAEVTQSGLYDFNLNTRGFNSSLNRRVATLIDGRNPAVPFLGAQEWAAVSYPLDDLASLELVRGPSAALYGANASSGVLNITTKQPRYSPGGQLRLTGGELATINADFRYAGKIAKDWHFKVNLGTRLSEDFSVSRNGFAEYSIPCTTTGQTDCLPQEAVPLARENDNEIYFGSLRVDKYMSGGSVLSVEGGSADVAGPIFQTGIGRVQVVDVKRPWARVNYAMDHWNVLLYYTGRDAPDQLALSSGATVVLDTFNFTGEVQTNWTFADDALRLVAGAAYTHEDVDSLNQDTGRQTLMFEGVTADKRAVFAQLDWKISEKFKAVLAGRYDHSSLHDAQFSPKGSLVYSMTPDHTLRFTYNEAFQVANYSEFFLQADVAPPVDLSPIEAAACTPFGVDCGFGQPTRVLALGNSDLELEETRTFEIGYSGIVDSFIFVTVDYYRSEHENFITDLVPQIDSLGNRTNPNFGPYQPPASHPAPAVLIGALQGALGPQYAILSNNFDDSPLFAAVSYTNFGQVDTQGVDVGLTYFLTDHWNLGLSYSWFDFEVQGSSSFSEQLLPNTPEHKATIGLTYTGARLDGTLGARWVDTFRWVVGPFQGDVLSYTTVDLGGNYTINDNWRVGLNVANLLDDRHWESFGGDLLGRRALAHVLFSW